MVEFNALPIETTNVRAKILSNVSFLKTLSVLERVYVAHMERSIANINTCLLWYKSKRENYSYKSQINQ